MKLRAYVVLTVASFCALYGRASNAIPTVCSLPIGQHTTSVCDDTTLNPQVKDALYSVCIHSRTTNERGLDEPAIVIGFLGGFVKRGDRRHPEVWFAQYLRERYPSMVFAEAFSNHEKKRALQFVSTLLDKNCDGVLSESEKATARIIIYGHSWGASECTAFVAELGKLGIPVLLTAQIDIVPKLHQKPLSIPPNVVRAVNFFEASGGFLHGQSRIFAVNAARTEIEGNFLMTYRKNPVDCGNFPWFVRTFNKSHHEIENDQRVWNQIDMFINASLRSSEQIHRASLAALNDETLQWPLDLGIVKPLTDRK